MRNFRILETENQESFRKREELYTAGTAVDGLGSEVPTLEDQLFQKQGGYICNYKESRK